MTALDKTPDNQNFLNPLNFQFSIKRAPHVNFFIQKVSIPSIALATINQPTMFMPIPRSGKIAYGDFKITFKVDEDLQNYLEIFLWMEHLGFPQNFDQYKEIASQDLVTGNGVTSDITLLVQDALRNPNYDFTMQDAYPVDLEMDEFTSTNPTINYVTATAVFRYLVMKIEKYNNG